MPFRFRLERLLRIKEAKEEELHQDLAEAKREADAARAAADALSLRLSEREEEMRMSRTGPVSIDRMRLLIGYADWLKGELVAAEERYSACKFEEESRRAALLEAMRERKILEALKERQYAAYLVEEARIEQRATDEMAQNVALRRPRGGGPAGEWPSGKGDDVCGNG